MKIKMANEFSPLSMYATFHIALMIEKYIVLEIVVLKFISSNHSYVMMVKLYISKNNVCWSHHQIYAHLLHPNGQNLFCDISMVHAEFVLAHKEN